MSKRPIRAFILPVHLKFTEALSLFDLMNSRGNVWVMDDKKYLLVKGTAGLGNRLLFLLSALLYARLTERLLVVDWCDSTYSNDGSNAFPLLFTGTWRETTRGVVD